MTTTGNSFILLYAFLSAEPKQRRRVFEIWGNLNLSLYSKRTKISRKMTEFPLYDLFPTAPFAGTTILC
jgi:hypothetical protein